MSYVEKCKIVATKASALRRGGIGRLKLLAAPGLRMSAMAIALLAIEFELLRLLLCLGNRQLAASTNIATLAWSFVVGLRFDLAVAAYSVMVMFVLAEVTHRLAGARWQRAVYVVMLVAFSGAFGLLGCAELEFYREFFSRYNSLALQYWSQPATVLRMIWYGYPVLRYVVLLFVAVALYSVFVRAVARRIFAGDATPRRDRWPVRLLRPLVVVAVLVSLARGGWRGTPLEWGDAMHSDSTFANELALNGMWTLGHAVLDTRRHDQLEQLWNRSLPIEFAQQHTRELLCLPHDELIGDGRVYPLLRAGNDRARCLRSCRLSPTRPNVVVIIMESFSARFVGAVDSDDDYTPEFNRLARHGILYDRCFSAGTHTHQANVGVLAGFPNLPGYEALMENFREGKQPFDSLPSALKQQGYRTTYFYNGDLAWENMQGFFRVQGFDDFVQRKDFDRRSHFDRAWGVCDEDLFRRVDDELSRSQTPFFAAVLTLSNHAPFDLPRPLPCPEVTDQDSMNTRLTGIRYADWAIGQFFERARRRPYFRNTVFVLVGDHGFSVAPMLTEMCLLRFHVPLLFYSPELLGSKAERIHTVVSQLDVAPTVLALVGDRSPHQHWGRDLFSLPPDDPGLAVFKAGSVGGEVGLARGDWLFVRTAEGRSRLYRYSLGFPASATIDDGHLEVRQSLETDLQAFLTTATDVLRRGRAAPGALTPNEMPIANRRSAHERTAQVAGGPALE